MKRLVKVIILAIVLVMNCFWSYSQTNHHSYGESSKDSVLVPMSYIRLANEKLIELKYIKKEIALKDSIIYLNNAKYDALDVEVAELQNKLDDANKINDNLNKSLSSYRNKYKFSSGCAAVAVATTIFLILFK